MAIYRGTGGASDSTDDSTISAVTTQADIATTKASEAAASASAASTSASNSAASASTASGHANTSSDNATASSGSVTDAAGFATAASNSATAASNSATAAASSASTANSTEVQAVAAKTTEITGVYNDIANVNTVAGNISNVNTVSGISSNITTVAADASDIGTVAGAIANVNTVGDNIASVNTVAGNNTNINTVAADASDIGTVAGISGNVTTVAGISSNVTTVAGLESKMDTVIADASDIGTVAGNIGDVTTVAGISSDVDTVAGISSDVTSVATNMTAVQNATTSATNAATSAASASDSASAAATSAGTANSSASDASTSETNATNSATAASNSATAASSSASAASGSESAASGSASAAASSASAASTSESNASNSETNAASSAAEIKELTAATGAAGSSASYNSSSGVLTVPRGDTGSVTLNSVSGNLTFGDNDKATFGASDDLQIYHDGSRSYISDQGTGGLRLLTNEFSVKSPNESENLFFSVQDGSTYLYENGGIKLNTTSTGIDVTGSVVADGLTVDGTATFNTASTLFANLNYFGSTKGKLSTDGINFNIEATANLYTKVNSATRMMVGGNGDISFYEDTGTTPKLFWDASKESLGIGTTSLTPTDGANIELSSATSARVILDSTGGSGSKWTMASGTDGSLAFYDYDASAYRMRIDSSGRVGIGTSSPSYKADILATNQYALRLNTTDADGCFLAIQTNGTAKGYLGTSHHLATNSPSEDDITLRAENNLQFTTGGGTERMRIDSSGRVGIGTSSPSQKLTLSNGTFQINGSSSFSSNVEIGRVGSNNNMGFATGGSERMRIDSSGRVGIGETGMSSYDSDADDLVVKTGGNTGITVRTSSTGTGSIFFSDGTSGAERYQGTIRYFHNGNAMAFGTSAAERMRIDSSGNVGIGQTAPKGPLHVYGTNYSYFTSNVAGVTPHSTTQGIALGWNKSGGAGESIIAHNKGGGSGGGLVFANNDGGVYREDMRIDSSGRVGIGTATNRLGERLTVNGNGILTSSSENTNMGMFGTFGSNNLIIGAYSNIPVEFRTNNQERMRIDSSGNLLVGKSSNSFSTAGFTALPSGTIQPVVDGGSTANFNRLTSDGTIVDFRKDGTTVGSIGSALGDSSVSTLFIADAGNVGIRFDQASTDDIQPCTSAGANRDNAINLGASNNRFKDLYLSGASRSGGMEVSGAPPLSFGASKLMVQQEAANITRLYTCGPDASTYGELLMYTSKSNGTPIESLRIQSNASVYLPSGLNLGGTGAANKLDDYETGTWTPTLIGSTSGSITGFSTSGVVYTKVGEIVTCHAYLTQIDESSSDIVGNIQIGGLPFSRGSLAANISVSYCNFAGVSSGEVVQGYAVGSAITLLKGSSVSALTASDIGTGTGKLIMLSITYQTNS